jgi:Protein of unknown function (DUF3352)
MRKLLLLLAVLSIAALVAAGCGDSGEPASGASELVPAGSVIYGEVNLRPQGDQKQAIDSILARFPGGGEAGEKLKDLIEKGLRESDAPISFKEDIEPWLGDEAAFFATGVGENGRLTASAGVIAADDEGKARDALERSAEGKTQTHDYKDVEYLTDDSDEAGAVFDGHLVLGSEAGVKAAIDASKGGQTLSDDEAYQKATEDVASDRLGLFYVNSPAFADAARRAGTPLPSSFDKFLDEPIVATVDADDDGIVVESDVPADLAKSFAFFGEGSEVLGEVPGDSWLAMGQKDLGELVDFYADVFAGVAGGRDAVDREVKAATGLDLQRDILSWMGDFAIFMRGTNLGNLDGALEVQTSDEAASARFLAAIERLVRTQSDGGTQVQPRSGGFTIRSGDVPKPIHAFVQDGKVVVAYGDAAAKDAVSKTDRLADSPDFLSVRESLGDYEISFIALVKPILDLVDSTPVADDADWQDAKPYLEPLEALVGGTSGSGDDLKSAFKLVVK